MRDDYKEQLSALVDDELRTEESKLLIARLGRDPEARRRLGRYSLIHDALHGAAPIAGGDLADRVAAALEDEPAHGPRSTSHGRARRLLRPVAGIAVAASVALMTIALWPTPGIDPDGSRVADAGDADLSQGAGRLVADGQRESVPAGSEETRRWNRLDPAVQQRLNTYVVNHSEHSSTGRFGGVLSYVRIAGHEAEQ